MSKLYCMYLRKSRADLEAEARGEGETLSRHRRTLTELAIRMHLPLGEVYDEIATGESIAARPQMQRMLADIETGMWAGRFVHGCRPPRPWRQHRSGHHLADVPILQRHYHHTRKNV